MPKKRKAEKTAVNCVLKLMPGKGGRTKLVMVLEEEAMLALVAGMMLQVEDE